MNAFDVLRSVSPSDPNDEIGTFPVADVAAVGAAVSRARRAFPAWRDAGLENRAGVLKRFAVLAQERCDELAVLIAREVGKALWDARSEASLLAPKVSTTLGDGMKLVAPVEPVAGARAEYHPRGVLAVIGPFNFPMHLPNGHIVPALATGNTVVFKPSEITPAAGEALVALFREAGLPDGVLECVQGGRDTGAARADEGRRRGGAGRTGGRQRAEAAESTWRWQKARPEGLRAQRARFRRCEAGGGGSRRRSRCKEW